MTFEAAAAHYNKLYEDDELAHYEPYERQRQLLEQFSVAESKFENMVIDLHIPFLDAKLFRKYFIAQKTEQNLANLQSVVSALSDHKQRTLLLLKCIFEREQIVNVIKVMAHDYAKGKLSTLEVQTKVLQLLHSLQQTTLRIVEGVHEWRARLTRPYSFEWRGINYFFKILKDCHFIDTCELNAVLPLQLAAHPLCSNLGSLSLFGPATKSDGSGVAITYPMKVNKRSTMPQVTPEFQQRLQRAEAMLFSEHNLQVNLLKELSAISASGAFLTVLDVKTVVPNCCDGIRLNNKLWDERVRRALDGALVKLQSKDTSKPDDNGSLVLDDSADNTGSSLSPSPG
eukprot:TRINITY_DN6188_c0_g1_i2.p1 TRINITY_DN6188_c0_g1~~TRINITY_DN6188_c0_g1_i2.p1  ORF type:complete len:342 (-),score=54.71 TRINITY_DN6188_c0_g1_i2:144-1169(-)